MFKVQSFAKPSEAQKEEKAEACAELDGSLASTSRRTSPDLRSSRRFSSVPASPVAATADDADLEFEVA
jgi:hypothetical protein